MNFPPRSWFQSAPAPKDRGNGNQGDQARPAAVSIRPGPEGPGKRWERAGGSTPRSVSIRPGPEGPGKRVCNMAGPARGSVSIRPGPEGPGKLRAPEAAPTVVVFQSAP